jgi:hypothetical protein
VAVGVGVAALGVAVGGVPVAVGVPGEPVGVSEPSGVSGVPGVPVVAVIEAVASGVAPVGDGDGVALGVCVLERAAVGGAGSSICGG